MTKDLIKISIVYVLAIVALCGSYLWLPIEEPIWRFLAADIIATLLVFAGSYLYNNTSVYDPFWSVIPPVIAAIWLFSPLRPFYLWHYIVFVFVFFWGIRLTLNWAAGWGGPSHEDWRYKMFRERLPRYYWIISLTGLHLFPTIMVFLGCIPLYYIFNHSFHNHWLNIIAATITFLSILLETIADRQKYLFKKTAKPQDICNRGIWRYSRHPNYLGEIGFWWGLGIFGIAASPGSWWLLTGAIMITVMFAGVSIPLMENRLLCTKPDYATYKKNTRVLVPGII